MIKWEREKAQLIRDVDYWKAEVKKALQWQVEFTNERKRRNELKVSRGRQRHTGGGSLNEPARIKFSLFWLLVCVLLVLQEVFDSTYAELKQARKLITHLR